MVAAEKFKAPEPSPATGDLPSTVAQTIQEESDEEVIVCVCAVCCGCMCMCHVRDCVECYPKQYTSDHLVRSLSIILN